MANGTGDLAKPQYRCIEEDSGDGCGNMLNTDFALFYEYNVIPNRRIANCDFSAASLTCDKADTFDTAQVYANDDDHNDDHDNRQPQIKETTVFVKWFMYWFCRERA